MAKKKQKTDSEKLWILAQAWHRFGVIGDLEELIDDPNINKVEQGLCRDTVEILAEIEPQF